MINDQAFLFAFNHSMIYEVGPFWNPNDLEVQRGLIQTAAQRKKVGYVNIAGDNGGLTKYGIAQNANRNVNVAALDLNQAMQIYFNSYWLSAKCNQIPYPVQIMHFDAAVNHGVGRAIKMLQEAVGAVPDGVIGPVTLAKVSAVPPQQIMDALNRVRCNQYMKIVNANPSQKKFLNGWMRRASEVYQFALSQMPAPAAPAAPEEVQPFMCYEKDVPHY